MTSTEDDFISGKPVTYLGFDGLPYKATYHRSRTAVPFLDVRHADTGSYVMQPIMSEMEARNFYNHIGLALIVREPAGVA